MTSNVIDQRWLLASPELFNEVIKVVVGEISRFYVRYSQQTFGKKGHYLLVVYTGYRVGGINSALWIDFGGHCELREGALAHNEPRDACRAPTAKPSSGRAPGQYWLELAELLHKTVGLDPKICLCGARKVMDDAINHASSFRP